MHFLLHVEVGNFVIDAGPAATAEPDTYLDGVGPAPIDPELPDDHEMPIGFHERGGGYDRRSPDGMPHQP